MNVHHILARIGRTLVLISTVLIALGVNSTTSSEAAARPNLLQGSLQNRALQQAEYQVVILTAPAPLTDSEGRGVGAGQAVGTGRIPGSTYPTETHALVWNPGSSVGVDLHPTDFRYSAALDSNGQQQVGSGNGPPTNFARHALLWNGSAASYIDLHPAGNWNDSVAQAIAGDQQVGNINFYYQGNESSPQSIVHAALWRGSAASVVDLHPSISGCARSYAVDTDGTRQVGHCYFSVPNTTTPYRALLWSGTAASAVVLHPSGYTHSFAEGVSGNEQVGYAFNTFQGDGYSRALLWRGTAASVVSLHPSGYLATTAYATNGSNQVGSGGTPDNPAVSHALRWSGTANSVVDLHLLLPTEFNSSIAYDIDAAGNIVGLAQRPDGSTVGAMWRRTSDTPQPTATPVILPTPTPGGTGLTNTGYRSPGGNRAVPGGDGNGYESNPANAYSDNGTFAVDRNSGTGTGTSCSGSGKDKHGFYNYGFAIPASATIKGIQVRLDAKADNTSGSPKLCVLLSWDGGVTWTAAKSTATLTTSEASYPLGSSSDTWGRTWNSGNFSNANFRVRVISVSSSTARDFSLDWVAVRVHYTP